MNAAGFWRGVVLAVILSAFGAAVFWLFAPLLGSSIAIRAVLLLVASGCVADLLLRSPVRAGRLLALLAWAASAIALMLLNPPLWMWWALPAALLWLLRAIGPRVRPLAALLDIGVVLIGIAAAMASLRTSGSVGLALWCFLLLQALAASLSIPRSIGANPADRFTTAQRSAEAALRSLLDPRSTR